MLHQVWEAKSQIESPDDVYALYKKPVEANPFSRPPDTAYPLYLSDLKSLATQRPPGSHSSFQGLPAEQAGEDEASPWIDFWSSGQLTEEGNQQIENGFLHFERANATDPIRERIYLNVRADHATEVMKHVVQTIVDDPGTYPGVAEAKIAGPGGVGQRSENIIIYTTDSASSDKVVEGLKRYQTTHSDHFNQAVPPMALPVLKGVATAAEPPPQYIGESFGSLRSSAIFAALQSTQGQTEEAFSQEVDNQFRLAGLDPDHPDRNLDSSAGGLLS